MNILKWIFQPAYLLLVIIVIALYINRETLFPELGHSDEVAAMLAKVETLIDDVRAPFKSAADSRETEKALIQSSSGSAPMYEDSPALSLSEAPLSPSHSKGGTTSLADRAGNTPDSSAGDIPVLLEQTAGSAQTADDHPVETLITGVDDISGEPPADLTVSSGVALHPGPAYAREDIWTLWQQARLAAWNGDGAGAIERYQTIIGIQPDSPDAYGEMGNVMLRIGDTEGAAEAYYQAAHRLVQIGERMRASQLLNVIARLSPSMAEKLYQELKHH